MEHERISFEDHLSFKEIARAWSKVSGDKPEMLMGTLVAAFWCGDFERDGGSRLFTLLKPDSARSELPPNITAPFQIVGGGQRRPGDSAIHFTAERKRFPILREDIARLFYTPWGRRGITLGEPADFEGCSFDKRDLVYPNWRAEYEDFYRALSTIPFEQWPTVPYDMRDSCSLWCIRRHDFARWYRASTLAAGVPLKRIWPSAQPEDTATTRSRTKRSSPERVRAEEALVACYPPDGKPAETKVPNWELLKKVNEWLANADFAPVKKDSVLRAAGRRK